MKTLWTNNGRSEYWHLVSKGNWRRNCPKFQQKMTCNLKLFLSSHYKRNIPMKSHYRLRFKYPRKATMLTKCGFIIFKELRRTWVGPYTVMKKINSVVHRIRCKMKVVHTNRLFLYRGGSEEADRDYQEYGEGIGATLLLTYCFNLIELKFSIMLLSVIKSCVIVFMFYL